MVCSFTNLGLKRQKSFPQAIKLQTDHAEAQFCLAMVLLQQGSFARVGSVMSGDLNIIRDTQFP